MDRFEELINKAIEVRENSYSPYSDFKVGAAILCSSGKIYTGTNVENASYGASICAERSAVAAAISCGERKFIAIAVVGGKDKLEFCPPCGICRQVLSEFCGDDFEILLYNGKTVKSYRLKELLPLCFGRDELC